MPRRKILFLAEGVTMTHVVRPLALAEGLNADEWDVVLRLPARYHRFVRKPGLKTGDLKTIEPQTFLDALAVGGVFYTQDTLTHYVEEDLAILREVRPDLVIGDFRLSLCISAPMAGVPFASLINAHWSPYRAQPAIVPDLPATRWIPPALLIPIMKFGRPIFFDKIVQPFRDVAQRHGVPIPGPYLQNIYAAGDLVLYPDIPEFVPVPKAAPHHHFIGIPPWSAPSQIPAWWDTVMASPEPKVFVSLGSSGPVKALKGVLEALSTLRVKVILSTSGRVSESIGPTVFQADLLPFEETAKRCAVVVSHGGTGAVYPSLAAGTPLLAIPSNLDSHFSSALLEKSGAGLSVRAEHASPRRLRHAFTRLLSEPAFKQAATRWQATIARYDAHKIFADVLNEWFARR